MTGVLLACTCAAQAAVMNVGVAQVVEAAVGGGLIAGAGLFLGRATWVRMSGDWVTIGSRDTTQPVPQAADSGVIALCTRCNSAPAAVMAALHPGEMPAHLCAGCASRAHVTAAADPVVTR